ncbi:MAG: lamin tail domain-containing protein [Anaerolineae bacterium]
MSISSLHRIFGLCLIFLALSILIFAQFTLGSSANAQATPQILIEKVYPDGLALNDADEAVQIINMDNEPVDLSGWGFSDDSGNLAKLTFPAGVEIAAGDRLWITRNGAEFELQFGFRPNFEQANSLDGLEQMIGSWPGFSNAGDEVILSDQSGQVVDALVYESSKDTSLASGGEWIGDPLEFYSVGAKAGQIFFRKLDQHSGLPIDDTNSAENWGQDVSDPISGRQVQYPGWEMERYFRPYVVTENATLEVVIAPDNAFDSISALFSGAKNSILIETHTFESHDLLTHLKLAAERGVDVKVLLEGGPPGGIDDAQRWNCHQLKIAGGNCFVMQNNSDEKIFDRYTFLHAKFMIIDSKFGVIGSDNLSPNSLPADDKSDGTFGRRGVTLITDASGVVDHLQMVFDSDLDQSNHRDILLWQPLESSLGFPLTAYTPQAYENGITHTVSFPEPKSFQGNFEFEIIQAPENFLNSENGLFGLLAKAGVGDTVLVQQQYERRYWGQLDEYNPNLRLEAYLAAARRGSKVEILLDSFFDDPDHPAGNRQACKWLLEIALDEGLDLLCQTGNPTGLGLHNKMVLAEIGGQGFIHVGSINGSEQSAKLNREIALQVQSDEAYIYLKKMFDQDFIRPMFMPLIYQEYEPPTDQLLISEVLYNPIGANDDTEFIEIYNPAGVSVDISGYSLSDAVVSSEYADLRRFPAGTIIPAGGIIVVTQQALPFQDQYFIKPDFEILDSDPTIPNLVDDTNWGDTSTFLRLGNSGDVVLFRNQFDNVIDVLVYGDKLVAGYPTCPAVIVSGASLRRNPHNYDTDQCSDFEEWGSPTPGQVP